MHNAGFHDGYPDHQSELQVGVMYPDKQGPVPARGVASHGIWRSLGATDADRYADAASTGINLASKKSKKKIKNRHPQCSCKCAAERRSRGESRKREQSVNCFSATRRRTSEDSPRGLSCRHHEVAVPTRVSSTQVFSCILLPLWLPWPHASIAGPPRR